MSGLVAESGETPEEAGVEELAQDTEPEGPDLSSLNSDGRALLYSTLEVLSRYDPQPGTLSDLPQVTVDRSHIVDVCRAVKDDDRVSAKMLLCLAAVDYIPNFGVTAHARRPAQQAEEEEEHEEEPEPVGRLEVVYFLQSLEPERTLVVKTQAPYEDPVVPSVTSVWRAADWHEREARDMYGITFDGHPDMTPLLLYDDFEGHPGRKDFPFYEYREF